MKLIAKLLIIIGLCFIGYGVFHIWESNRLQDASLKRAEEIITNYTMQANLGNEINKNNETKTNNPTIHSKEELISFSPEIGEEVGILYLPKLNQSLPIIEGVDEDELAQGVGHYRGTHFPSENGQIVLSGHRDTVFRRLGELVIGDELEVKMPYGTFTYIIDQTEIVDADDLSVIRPDDTEEYLTLTTCYPFSFIGNAPDRYIIYAKPA